jgi:tetratricopeptide (TPR) repeat protein
LKRFDPEGREPSIALELRHLRAEAQVGLGQFSEARSAYEDIKNHNADDARVPLGLARIDLIEHKFDDAEAHAAAALSLNPDLPEAILLRAEVLRLKRQPEGAVPLYRTVLDDKRVSLVIRAQAQLGLAAVLIGGRHQCG